jgi:hypothetical protein
VSSVCGGIFCSRGDWRIRVILVAVGGEYSGCVHVIGGTVPGTLLRVSCRWTRLVDLSAHLVVGLGAFMIGGAFDICWRLSAGVTSGVRPTLCCPSGAGTCVGAISWDAHWWSLFGSIRACHGLVRKAGPQGRNESSANFARTSVSTRYCSLAGILVSVDIISFVTSCN